MKRIAGRNLFKFLGFIFLLNCSLMINANAATVLSDAKTGFVELEGYNYPVYLFVPEQYKPMRPLPLIISFPGDGEDFEEHAKSWENIATRNSLIVAVPTVKPREGSTPGNAEDWLLRVKEGIATTYSISPGRTYLIGKDSSANYVSYLGMQHPSEFSGVALLNGSWVGALDKVMNVSQARSKQTIFFVSYDTNSQNEFAQAEMRASELSGKGYLIHIETLPAEESFEKVAFRKRLIDWLEENSILWQGAVAESQTTKKERLKNWLKRNIKVD